jgi:hypothetical protein
MPRMSPVLRRSSFALAVVALVATGCGDDDEDDTASSFEIDTPAVVTSSLPPPTAITIAPITIDTTDIPAITFGTADIPFTVPDTSDIPVAAPTTIATPVTTATPLTTPGAVLIEIVVGEDTGPERIELVPLGALVTLTVVNPDDHDEFHLHGYDLGDGQEFDEGETATFTFTANTAGDFELESHDTEDVIAILRVQ